MNKTRPGRPDILHLLNKTREHGRQRRVMGHDASRKGRRRKAYMDWDCATQPPPTMLHRVSPITPSRTERTGAMFGRDQGHSQAVCPESSLLLLLSYESVLGSTCSRHNHTVSLAANQKPFSRPLRQANGHDNCLNQNTQTGDSWACAPGADRAPRSCPEVLQPFTGYSSLPLAGTKKKRKEEKKNTNLSIVRKAITSCRGTPGGCMEERTRHAPYSCPLWR